VDGVLQPVHGGNGMILCDYDPCTRRSRSNSSSTLCKFPMPWTASRAPRRDVDEEDGFFYDLLRLPDGQAMRLKVRSLVDCCRCAPRPCSMRKTCCDTRN